MLDKMPKMSRNEMMAAVNVAALELTAPSTTTAAAPAAATAAAAPDTSGNPREKRSTTKTRRIIKVTLRTRRLSTRSRTLCRSRTAQKPAKKATQQRAAAASAHRASRPSTARKRRRALPTSSPRSSSSMACASLYPAAPGIPFQPSSCRWFGPRTRLPIGRRPGERMRQAG